MPVYQLRIKQLVSYPRCRIYREFFQTLIADRGVRLCGRPGLFSFAALCSLTSPQMTSLRVEGVSYTIQPGEHICPLIDLSRTLQLRSRSKTLNMLQILKERGLLQYTILGHGKMVRYKILEWRRCNGVLSDNCPNQQPGQFFFLPAATVTDLISSVKCSEMDILLDLLCSAVYRDERVKGSYSAPVVYFRNGTSSAMAAHEDLCKRWGLSRAAVRRVLLRLERAGFITLRGSPGCPELMIYLAGELAASFQIPDILADKDELPMDMRVQFPVAGDELPNIKDMMAERVLHLLDFQGIGCTKCRRCTYDLYLLPRNRAEKGKGIGFRMDILCGCATLSYSFDLSLSLCEN